MVDDFREQQPMIGTRKLQKLLANEGIEIGRDALFELLARNNRLVRRSKRYVVHTTNSRHKLRKYPNLIIEQKPLLRNQIWVADITYIRIKDTFAYLSLITDLFSHKIVGHCLHNTLEVDGCIMALYKALSITPWKEISGIIHHSDRGVQYCSSKYVSILKQNNMRISMTQNGSPYENAVAERVNGILKREWINNLSFNSFEQATLKINEIIEIYNNKRPHFACNLNTPNQMHVKYRKTSLSLDPVFRD